MNNRLIVIFTVFLLALPGILADVKVHLGEPRVNIKDLSELEGFKAHSDYYEICSLDKTIIPVLIKNNNKFSDIFSFDVDKDYASLPVKSAVLKSGKSAILPLTISPPLDLGGNTTLILDIITKEEGLKRSVIIKTNIKNCYLFDLEINKEKDEVCGCDKAEYSVILSNKGSYEDIFTLSLDMPGWVNSTLTNGTIKLSDGQKKEIILEASPGCEENGVFIISAEAVSERTRAVLEDGLELTVLPQKECYNTIITAEDASIDYFGKNVPITIKNKGARDAAYSLSVEGVEWYVLSQNEFSIKPNNEKTINLALHPDENAVEGEYYIDIKAESYGHEFTKSIKVKLRSKSTIFEKAGFYLNYFRYYIGGGIVLLVIILFLIVLARKRATKREKVKETPKEEAAAKEVEKAGEKKAVVKKAKKLPNWIRWLLSFVLYLAALGLLALLGYSTFKYRPYYEKALNFISGLFTNYIAPYGYYLRYVVLGVGIVIVILLIADFIRKKPKGRMAAGEEEVKKEKPKEKKLEKKETRKASEKRAGKRKGLRFFEYAYIVLVVLLFLAIAAYLVYRFFGKPISCDKCALAAGLVKGYYLYFIIGVIILALLILAVNFLRKKGKDTRKAKEKKLAKKIGKKTKRLVRNILIISIGLIALSGIVYFFVYYNLTTYIMDFFIIYYPYILMGIGILVISILILHFHSKKIL